MAQVLASGSGVAGKCCVGECWQLLAISDKLDFFRCIAFHGACQCVGSAVVAAWGGWNLLLGALCIALPWWVADPFFNAASLQWLGLGTVVSSTKDYTPLLPWFGVMLLGVYAGSNLEHCQVCLRPLPRWGWIRGLSWLGRNSLAVYLLHQPLLMALFWLVVKVMPDATGI